MLKMTADKRYIDYNTECAYAYRIASHNETLMESRVRFLKLMEKAGAEISYIYYSAAHDMWEDWDTKDFRGIRELESDENYMLRWSGVESGDWSAEGKYQDIKLRVFFSNNHAEIRINKQVANQTAELVCRMEPLYFQDYPQNAK